MSALRRSPIARPSPARSWSTTPTRSRPAGCARFARSKTETSRVWVGGGYLFESKIIGGTVTKEYIPGVEKGLLSALGAGPIAGFAMVDVKVLLVDGAYHDVDSSALAFEIAARAALREALHKAGPVLLEP